MDGTVPSRKPQELDPETILTALGMHSAPAEPSRSAFAKLYVHYEPRVRYAVGRAVARSGHRGTPEDIRQDVWCYFARPGRGVLRYYDPHRGPFGPFIQRLAYQRALVAIQQARPHPEQTALTTTFEVEPEDPDTERAFARFLQSDYLDKLLEMAEADLDDNDRLLLREVYRNGRSCLAFAKEHNINNNTIYKRHERLKNKLKRWVTRLDPTPSDPRTHSTLAALLALVLANAGGSDGSSSDPPQSPSTPRGDTP